MLHVVFWALKCLLNVCKPSEHLGPHGPRSVHDFKFKGKFPCLRVALLLCNEKLDAQGLGFELACESPVPGAGRQKGRIQRRLKLAVNAAQTGRPNKKSSSIYSLNRDFSWSKSGQPRGGEGGGGGVLVPGSLKLQTCNLAQAKTTPRLLVWKVAASVSRTPINCEQRTLPSIAPPWSSPTLLASVVSWSRAPRRKGPFLANPG